MSFPRFTNAETAGCFVNLRGAVAVSYHGILRFRAQKVCMHYECDGAWMIHKEKVCPDPRWAYPRISEVVYSKDS